MKTLLLLFLMAALSCVQAQAPLAARPSQQQALQTLKAQNQKLIEQQAATLLKLEELKKAASQLRIFARRS